MGSEENFTLEEVAAKLRYAGDDPRRYVRRTMEGVVGKKQGKGKASA